MSEGLRVRGSYPVFFSEVGYMVADPVGFYQDPDPSNMSRKSCTLLHIVSLLNWTRLLGHKVTKN